MGNFPRDYRDAYACKAKLEGFRARSAFKLLEVDEVYRIFDGITNVVDLCSAPGSWSQALSRKFADRPDAKLVAVDLQPIEPIPNVVTIQGDVTSLKTVNEILACFSNGSKAQLVLCDGAPDVTGNDLIDEELQFRLIVAALRITACLLAENGTFVCKILYGNCVHAIREIASVFFDDISIHKPKSSRLTSTEHFLIAKGFAQRPEFLTNSEMTVEDVVAAIDRTLNG